MARLLLIVSRTEPVLYTSLKHVFDSGTADVILDRRVGDRRRRQEWVAIERRPDRRQRDLTEDLKTFGWALVRRWPRWRSVTVMRRSDRAR